MNFTVILLGLATAALMSVGQMLFKKAATVSAFVDQSNIFLKYFTNLWFLVALAVFGIATLVWVFALSKGELSILYPVTSVAYVIVPVLSVFVYGEKLTPIGIVGILVILAGITLVASSSPS